MTPKDAAQRSRRLAAVKKWRGTTPGIPPKLATRFVRDLRGGCTIKDLTKPVSKFYVVPRSRFEKHCELHPAWKALVYKLSRLSHANKVRTVTAFGFKDGHCAKRGHPITDDNILRDKEGRPRCKACQNLAHAKPMTPEQIDRSIAALKGGASLDEISCGIPTGGGPFDRSLIIVHYHRLAYQRRIDPDFARTVEMHIQASNEIGQTLRHARAKGMPPETKPVLINIARLKHRVKTMRRAREKASI